MVDTGKILRFLRYELYNSSVQLCREHISMPNTYWLSNDNALVYRAFDVGGVYLDVRDAIYHKLACWHIYDGHDTAMNHFIDLVVHGQNGQSIAPSGDPGQIAKSKTLLCCSNYEHHLASESGTWGSDWSNHADIICYAILNELKAGNTSNATMYYAYIRSLYTTGTGFHDRTDGWYDAYKLGLVRYVHKAMQNKGVPYDANIDADANSILTILQSQTTTYSTQDGIAQGIPTLYDANKRPSPNDSIGGNAETNAHVVIGTIGYDW